MARTQIVHSSQATTLLVKGDKNNPEPIHQIIIFSGGQIELTRCSDNEQYWVHIHLNEDTKITDSRQAYDYDTYIKRQENGLKPIHQIDDAEHITQLALKVKGTYQTSETL
ncbi:hypothetical protein FG071_13845 [Vibrio cholerae]|nr:hypothetical protein [Vibrio cholerae]